MEICAIKRAYTMLLDLYKRSITMDAWAMANYSFSKAGFDLMTDPSVIESNEMRNCVLDYLKYCVDDVWYYDGNERQGKWIVFPESGRGGVYKDGYTVWGEADVDKDGVLTIWYDTFGHDSL